MSTVVDIPAARGASARILTINSGSSSLKFALWEMGPPETLLLRGAIDRIGLPGGTLRVQQPGAGSEQSPVETSDHDAAIQVLFDWLRSEPGPTALDAVGHRVVHGGSRFTRPARIDDELLAALDDLVPLAPNHLPQEIRVIHAVRKKFPALLQAACFDTAFHRDLPAAARTFALPRRFRDEGVIRYGFHGLSYEYVMEALRQAAPQAAAGPVVIAHLGNGASMAAVRDGVGIDTTMGFTPTGGLVMGTRTGDLDPGVMLHLLSDQGLSPDALARLVNHEAGLLGLSGVSSDMRELLGREGDDSRAAEAIAVYCWQARKYLAAMAASLGGLGTLIFTGGIGENSPPIRWRICENLAFLGIHIDPARNDSGGPVISPEGSPATVRVIRTNEELMIARHTTKLLSNEP